MLNLIKLLKVNLNLEFIISLTKIEGSFFIIKNNDNKAKNEITIKLKFKITILNNKIYLINKVQSFLIVILFTIIKIMIWIIFSSKHRKHK